ncbi:X2-like carbohydrate binding domain-containing protein [Paenibacillus hemerocallicola]|nr:X2-like carbohydrate binding domain-containing protein [Paenibacillus hemerocallicola]
MSEVQGVALDANKQIWTFYSGQVPVLHSLSVTEHASNVRFKAISTGSTYGFSGSFSVALDENGELWTWGEVIHSYQGELGNGDQTGAAVSVPTRITVSDSGAPVKFKQVHAGNKYVLAIDTNNMIWTWGYNGSRQLGDGTTNNQYVPHKLSVMHNGNPVQFQEVNAGQGVSFAIDTNGRTWAWGKQFAFDLPGLQTTPARFYLQPGITLTSSPSSSTYLQQVALKATVTGDYLTPTGTVEFKDGATVLGTASLNGSGEAQLNVSNLAAGSRSLTASYSGNDIYATKVTGSQTHSVSMPAAPDIQITPSTTANTAGPITLNVAVQANGSGNSIASTKWMAGTQNVSAFASAGTNVSGGSFQVSNSGAYTVYVKDSAGNETVSVYTVANINSEISPTAASFDKYTGATGYVDVTTTLTLKGNTLTSIKNGVATLSPGSDYTVSGNTVAIRKEYLAGRSTGATTLTFTFSGGATKTLQVSVSDTTPSISPMIASFDKYTGASGYADVTTTMTLNGFALTSIKNGAATLASGTDYTVSGNTVAIRKEYLAARSNGTTTLTFTFSGGATKTLQVSVNDTTPSISPITASFDKYTGASGYADVTTTMTLNSDTLTSIQNGAAVLTAETDYTVSGNTVTIRKEYLAARSNGTTTLSFTFSGGVTRTLQVSVSDTTPSISPMTARFDKYTGAAGYVDVTTTMTLNGHPLTSIKNDAAVLTAGTDYTVSGNTATIRKAYLAGQSTGTTNLTFTFSGGATQTLAVAVDDSTPSMTPTTASFDRYAGSLHHVDVTTELTLHGDTLVGITNSGAPLTSGTDYTFSGTTVTLAQWYFASQPVGTTSLMFTFSGGATQMLEVAVADTTPIITPTTASFDRYAGSLGHVDVTAAVTLHSDTLVGITNGVVPLTGGIDYTFYGSAATIARSYLASQPVGATSMTFTFSGGATQILEVSVSDTTPIITPTTASFDRYAGVAQHVYVTTALTLHNDTLVNITNSGAPLTAGIDYTISGSTVTLAKSYLAAQPVGTISLTYAFSGGATQTLAVAVDDSTPSISPTTASFDRYAGSLGHVDVSTGLSLHSDTLVGITNNGVPLTAGIDYTISGSTATLARSYLAAQPVGTTSMTFTFSGGATQTLEAAVSDTTPIITPMTASFDRYAGSLGHADATTAVTLHNDTLVSITNGGVPLTEGMDYTFNGSTVTIATSYLAAQPVGTTSLTFAFSGGATQTLAVAVSDTTPIITPTTGNFDRYTGSLGHVNVTTTLTLHSDTLVSLTSSSGAPLTEGIDYTLSGSTVTLAKSYLAAQQVGTTSLTITFSGGATQTLAVAVSDTTPSITPTTASFDRYTGAYDHADVITTLTLHNDTLVSLTNSGAPLTAGIDYTVSGNTVSIAKSYVEAQPYGTTSLTFTFSRGATQTLSITIGDTTPESSGGVGGNSSSPPNVPLPDAASPVPVKPTYRIEEDPLHGVILYIDSSLLVTQLEPDGTTVQKALIPDSAVTEAANLLSRAARPQLIIRVADTASDIQIELSGGAMETISNAAPGAVVEVAGQRARMELQAGGFNLVGLARLLGVAVADLKIVTAMEQVSGDIVKQLQQAGVDVGFQVVGTPINFQVYIEANGQIISIRDMGGTYLVRAIIHDADTEPGHVLAVYFDPATGSVVPVPNKRIMREDGQVEVEMQSPNYRIYSMVSTTKRSFADLKGHWSQQDVELLASKLIVNGVSSEHFAPDVSITRAEFASLLVRSLGMSVEKDQAYRGFDDVASDAWYALAIEAASKAGLVNGISATEFAPNEPITREQMAVMIARAQTLVRTLQGTQSEADSVQLQTFADMQTISSWALRAVGEMVASGIMNGIDPSRFAPAEWATRAQAATILKRFMQSVGFIDG